MNALERLKSKILLLGEIIWNVPKTGTIFIYSKNNNIELDYNQIRFGSSFEVYDFINYYKTVVSISAKSQCIIKEDRIYIFENDIIKNSLPYIKEES